MRALLPIGVLFGSLLLVALVSPASGLETTADLEADGWEQTKTARGVNLYVREDKAAETREVLAVGEADLPTWKLWAALNDYPRYPEFMPYVQEARVLSREGGVAYVYQVLDLPWPIGNRCYTVRVEMSEPTGPSGAYRRAWDLAPEDRQAEKNCGVVPKTNRGSWLLEPIDGGRRTRLTYHVASDPGGQIPRWAVNRANQRAIPKLFDAVRQQAATGPYTEPSSAGP